MNRIRQLDKSTIAKIAAGEVVERPASVVKELIENSIDADSSVIVIRIEEAGKKLIEIIDDGVGMSPVDAEMAFQQHATSKIKTIDDLATLYTMGFRGEALSSIASVSEIDLQTFNNQDSTRVQINQNSLKKSSGSITKGTRIQVKNLFSTIPARKKFLRSDATEFKLISDIFIRHAIAHPTISFKLFHNEKEIYNLPATKELKTRIFDIFGKKISSQLVSIYYDAPDIKIEGFITSPEVSKKSRAMQFLFLNNRTIKSDLVTQAVEKGYQSLLHQGYYPPYFLNIKIDPKLIDINVHPRKMEVKFENTQSIFYSVKHATKSAISKNAQERVKHTLLDNTYQSYDGNSAITSPPKIYSSISKNNKSHVLRDSGKQVQSSLAFTKKLLTRQTGDMTKDPVRNDSLDFEGFSYNFHQFFLTYILFEREDKLVFVDQHAAHERINYEKIMLSVQTGLDVQSQPLLVPIIINIDKNIVKLVEEKLALFKSIGLEIDIFGSDTLKIDSIPAILSKFNFEGFIDEVIENEVFDLDKSEILHKLVASLACHGSIRAGKKLDLTEMRQLISDLFKCKKPATCPHGRPVYWEFPKKEIEKNFKRLGFC